MASRSASRTVVFTISVPSGTSGSTASAFVRRGGGRVLLALDFAGLARLRLVGAAGLGGPRRLDVDVLALSPSSTSTAMGVLTFTPSVPSAIRILPTRPSSTASNSIVALSVSISARMSPEETVSPSFTSHLASVPSSIVGDRAGIRTSVAMSSRLPQASCGTSLA